MSKFCSADYAFTCEDRDSFTVDQTKIEWPFMSLNLRNFTRSIYLFDAVVHRVAPEDWDNQSPCEDWSAREVFRHHCGVLAALTATLESGETVPPKSVDSDTDPMSVWPSTRDAALQALDQPGILQREGKFWFGPMSVDQWIGIVQWDPLTHAWDIGKATGLEPYIPDDLAAASHEVIAPMREMLAGWGVVGDEVEVSDSATAAHRFLALTGRDPS